MKVFSGRTDCAPEEVGYDSRRLDAVNEFFARMIRDGIIFGASYRLARRGKVFAAASLGSRHYAKPDMEILPETPYRLASQTKVFTAVAIFMLAEDGLVSIDDYVRKFLPQFADAPYNGITIAHLLTHTSGLYPEGSIPDAHHIGTYEHIEREFEKNGDAADWIAAGLRGGMRRKPGEEWQYCSYGIQVLGAIVEKTTGMKFKDFVLEKICAPLGMTATAFDISPETAARALVFSDRDEKNLAEIQARKRGSSHWDLVPPASSGLYSTAEDMIRFGMMLQNGGRLGDVRILGRKAIDVMATQHLTNVPNFCWGGNEKDRKHGLGVDMRRNLGAFFSPGTIHHEGAGHSVTLIDRAEEMVCTCVYPWVTEWNGDCNFRQFNVMWSGLM